MPAWRMPCCCVSSSRNGISISTIPGSHRASSAPISFIAACRPKLSSTRSLKSGSATRCADIGSVPRSIRLLLHIVRRKPLRTFAGNALVRPLQNAHIKTVSVSRQWRKYRAVLGECRLGVTGICNNCVPQGLRGNFRKISIIAKKPRHLPGIFFSKERAGDISKPPTLLHIVLGRFQHFPLVLNTPVKLLLVQPP